MPDSVLSPVSVPNTTRLIPRSMTPPQDQHTWHVSSTVHPSRGPPSCLNPPAWSSKSDLVSKLIIAVLAGLIIHSRRVGPHKGKVCVYCPLSWLLWMSGFCFCQGFCQLQLSQAAVRDLNSLRMGYTQTAAAAAASVCRLGQVQTS